MRVWQPVCLVWVASLSFACAYDAPPLPPRPPRMTSGFEISNALPTPEQKYSVRPVDGSYFGVTARSLAALPSYLVLGPILGSLIEQPLTESVNRQQSDRIRDIMAIDLRAWLQEIASAAPPQVGAGPPMDTSADELGQAEITPAANMTFVDGEHFRFLCFLHARLVQAGKETWKGRYVFSSAAEFSPESADLVSDVSQELKSCLGKVYQLYRDHTTGTLNDLKFYTFKAANRAGKYTVLPTFRISAYVDERRLPDVIALDSEGAVYYEAGLIEGLTQIKLKPTPP